MMKPGHDSWLAKATTNRTIQTVTKNVTYVLLIVVVIGLFFVSRLGTLRSTDDAQAEVYSRTRLDAVRVPAVGIEELLLSFASVAHMMGSAYESLHASCADAHTYRNASSAFFGDMLGITNAYLESIRWVYVTYMFGLHSGAKNKGELWGDCGCGHVGTQPACFFVDRAQRGHWFWGNNFTDLMAPSFADATSVPIYIDWIRSLPSTRSVLPSSSSAALVKEKGNWSLPYLYTEGNVLNGTEPLITYAVPLEMDVKGPTTAAAMDVSFELVNRIMERYNTPTGLLVLIDTRHDKGIFIASSPADVSYRNISSDSLLYNGTETPNTRINTAVSVVRARMGGSWFRVTPVAFAHDDAEYSAHPVMQNWLLIRVIPRSSIYTSPAELVRAEIRGGMIALVCVGILLAVLGVLCAFFEVFYRRDDASYASFQRHSSQSYPVGGDGVVIEMQPPAAHLARPGSASSQLRLAQT